MKDFLINILFLFSIILCLHIFILYIFRITGQSFHFHNHLNLLSPKQRTYYMMYEYQLQFVCFLWVQVLPSLLLNSQHFNKYFDIVYNIFHIFIPLTLYLITWRIWWAPNNASKGQMGFNWAFKMLNVYIMTWFC